MINLVDKRNLSGYLIIRLLECSGLFRKVGEAYGI